MILKRVIICAFALMVLASVASAEELIKDQVVCYTTWDDSYFYISYKIDSPDVRGSQSKPNVDLAGDDTVEFYIETDNKRAMKISPACFSMSVSAAGGSCFKHGSEGGVLAQTPAFTFKYGSTVQGTINNADDIDMGYSIEMAVPWALLKRGVPSIGDMMTFNVVIRTHGDKSDKFVSLAPRVKSEADLLIPAKWANIVFAAHSFGVATTSSDKILSAKYVARSPLIDGVISDREWHKNTSFALDLPMPLGFVYEAKYPIQRMVLAKYLYWYQADKRRDMPVTHISNPDGSSSLVELPTNGVGPWFTGDRVQWHKDELVSIANTGINVILPDYLGAASVDKGFADKGLDCLVSAIEELQKEGKPYPMVGMFFDGSRLPADVRDFDTDADMSAFYGSIKSFFSRVPSEFCAYAPAGKPNSGKPASIVFVANASELNKLTPAVLTYCSDRFIKDFGCPLVWASDSGVSTDVCISMNPGISVGNVTCADNYDSQWNSVLAANPLWIYCDAWNDFNTGKCICATQSLGSSRAESTKAHIKRFLVARDYSARFLRINVPKVISQKQIAQAEVVIRNTGNSTWRVSDGYALGYRWYRSGRYFGESKVRMPISSDVAPGDTVNMTVGIATVAASGSVLPEGNCELKMELIRLSDNKWFSTLGDMPLMLPIKIGKLADFDATYISCSAPNMVAPNFAYPTSVRVRNDGTQTWSVDSVKLDCRLFKVQRSNPDDPGIEIPINPIRATLSKPCRPGEIAEFKTDLMLASKKPIDVSKLDDTWTYQIQFDILNGTKEVKRFSESGGAVYARAINIFSSDYGPRIVDSDVPATVGPGKSVEAKVVFRNTGMATWDAKKTKIGYHWYSRNGNELEWEGIATPIKTKAEPGWPAVVNAIVQAPAQEGNYVLVWDVMMDGNYLSTCPLSRGGDILPIAVEVKK